MPGPSADSWRRTYALLNGALLGVGVSVAASLVPALAVHVNRVSLACLPVVILCAALIDTNRVPVAALYAQAFVCGIPLGYALRLLLIALGYASLGVSYAANGLYLALGRLTYTVRLW